MQTNKSLPAICLMLIGLMLPLAVTWWLWKPALTAKSNEIQTLAVKMAKNQSWVRGYSNLKQEYAFISDHEIVSDKQYYLNAWMKRLMEESARLGVKLEKTQPMLRVYSDQETPTIYFSFSGTVKDLASYVYYVDNHSPFSGIDELTMEKKTEPFLYEFHLSLSRRV